MLTLISPLYVTRNKKGDRWYLNLNNYRNTHFQSLNQYKKKYKLEMASQILSLPLMAKANLTYVIYPKTKQLFDIMNIASVVDKFFCDAVTELGRIKDDNYKFIPQVSVEFGSVDKLNPRCEIRIKYTMKVIVTQEEMVQAVIAQFNLPEGTEVALEVLEAVKEVAEVAKSSNDIVIEPTKPVKRKRRTRAEIEAAKPVEEENKDGDIDDQLELTEDAGDEEISKSTSGIPELHTHEDDVIFGIPEEEDTLGAAIEHEESEPTSITESSEQAESLFGDESESIFADEPSKPAPVGESLFPL